MTQETPNLDATTFARIEKLEDEVLFWKMIARLLLCSISPDQSFWNRPQEKVDREVQVIISQLKI